MKGSKDTKEAVASYGLHPLYVSQLVKTQASRNKVTPHDWLQLVSAVLDHVPQLQWESYWREEAKALEHQSRVRGFEASQDQILEGCCAYFDSEAIYNEHSLSLCCIAALAACDKIQKLRKRIESYTKVIQRPREPFSAFLQRLNKSVQIGVADPETRRVLIETLTLKMLIQNAKRYLDT